MNVLPPEIEEGNVEYKRCFKDISKRRIYELTSQMNWRLNEGDGYATYYLGINDDGTVYGIDEKESEYSLDIMKQITSNCKAIITNIETIDCENKKIYYKISIMRNSITNVKEYRILLLGDMMTGKTTFLANLIKKKINIDNEYAKNYIYKHKHELETGKTSSINYYVYMYNDTKYLFFDSPGDSKYMKTLLKIIQSIDYNLVLYFQDGNWKYEKLFFKYFELKKTPIVNIITDNTVVSYNSNHITINPNKLIDGNVFINEINKYIKELESVDNKIVNFNILDVYHNTEIGWLVSGFLKSGDVMIGDKLYLYPNSNDTIYNIMIKSIHCSNSNLQNSNNMIKSPQILTLCIDFENDMIEENVIKYGLISNNIYKILSLKNSINIKWLNRLNNTTIYCYTKNKKFTTSYIDNNIVLHTNIRNDIVGEYIIDIDNMNIGLVEI